MPDFIENARHRLEVLWQDTDTEEKRTHRRISAAESSAIRAVLNEQHRLNVAVSTQEKELHELRTAPKRHQRHHANSPLRKPSAACRIS